MVIGKRPTFKTANGQLNFMKAIFERDNVNFRSVEGIQRGERRTLPKDLGPQKMWMRRQLRHELEQQYYTELFTGILIPGEAEVFLKKILSSKVSFDKASELVKIRAQNKFGSIKPTALEKARTQLVSAMEKLIKRNNSIVQAQRELASKINEYPKDNSPRSIAFYNAIDAYAQISSAGQNAEILLIRLKKSKF